MKTKSSLHFNPVIRLHVEFHTLLHNKGIPLKVSKEIYPIHHALTIIKITVASSLYEVFIFIFLSIYIVLSWLFSCFEEGLIYMSSTNKQPNQHNHRQYVHREISQCIEV